jgi:hypothetical protein
MVRIEENYDLWKIVEALINELARTRELKLGPAPVIDPSTANNIVAEGKPTL